MVRTVFSPSRIESFVCLAEYRRWGNAISDFMLLPFPRTMSKMWAKQKKK